jgi:hypothetical protein
MMRRFPVLLVVALLIVGLVPVAASALTSAEEFAKTRFLLAVSDADCATIEGCVEALAEFETALALSKESFPDVDYGAFEAALADLETAIEGGDLDAIKVAADAVNAAGTTVVADVAAAVAAPTAVDTGSPVDDGPNVVLLGVAALLVLLAGGALAFRLNADRR